MTPGLSAIAFDLDGTLYPNYRLNLRLMPFLLRNWRLLLAFSRARSHIRREQEKSPSLFQSNFYDYQAHLTAQWLHVPAEQCKEYIEKLIYRALEPHFHQVQLFPHVRELLTQLQAMPIKLGLLSDFPPHIKLENLNIADYWDVIMCSEATGALKPALRPFTELAGALGCPPGEILYVGNHYRYDVIGAKRAGFKTALISGRFARKTAQPAADFIFHDYRTLRDFMLQ